MVLKTFKKIFSVFNLFLFVGTFGFTSLRGFTGTQNFQDISHIQKQFVSKQNSEDGGLNQLFLEKSENETENKNESDQPIQCFLLSFLISYFQPHLAGAGLSALQPLAAKQTNPIYLSVCNLRV